MQRGALSNKMKICLPKIVIQSELDGDSILKRIESLTRVCYKSHDKTTESSHKDFVKKVLHTFKHDTIAEFGNLTFTMITDRGVMAEVTRHRHASFLVESTRYVNYESKGLDFVLPSWIKIYDINFGQFCIDCESSEDLYIKNLRSGWKPQEARYFLPNGIRTQIGCNMNFGSLRNFLKKRSNVAAHPSVRQLTVPLLKYLKNTIPVIFDDIETPELPYDEARLEVNLGFGPIEAEYIY